MDDNYLNEKYLCYDEINEILIDAIESDYETIQLI